MDICESLGIHLLWGVGGGKIQSSSVLTTLSGMVGDTPTEVDGVDITPTRVEVVAGGDISKNGDY